MTLDEVFCVICLERFSRSNIPTNEQQYNQNHHKSNYSNLHMALGNYVEELVISRIFIFMSILCFVLMCIFSVECRRAHESSLIIDDQLNTQIARAEIIKLMWIH